MAMSAKERMRRYREKLKEDPEKYLQYQEKDRQRWHERRNNKKVKTISDMTTPEHAKQKERWRSANQRRQQRKTEQKKIDAFLAVNSPPTSPVNPNDGRRNQGRRRIRRDRATAYRQLNKVKLDFKTQRKLTEKYKKRYQRLRQKVTTMETEANGNKITKATQRMNSGIVEEIKEKMKNGNQRERKLIGRVVSGKILQKYRLVRSAAKELSVNVKMIHRNKSSHVSPLPRSNRKKLAEVVKDRVRAFFTRDDNSRMTSGKKQTITLRKIKKQKRFLLDSVMRLYSKYQAENPMDKIHITTFRKLKPFWVVTPTAKDRETCLCKTHENVALLVSCLTSRKILESTQTSSRELCKTIVCDINSKSCMYRECDACSQKCVEIHEDIDEQEQIVWYQWSLSQHEYMDKQGNKKVAKKTVKEASRGTVKDAIVLLNEHLIKFCRHVYNIHHQNVASNTLKDGLSKNEAIIHIDFAENFLCKYGSEIQAVHFGASHQQATLHTGVLYTSDVCLPFCTISNSLRHDPVAIWNYLDPLLRYVNMHHEEIQHLHFQSDGPSTQYRNRTNFFLMSTIPFDMGYHDMTWSFWEAGHGKGAPDGVGAVLKRTADALINKGQDILDGEGLFHALEDKSVAVKLFFVDEGDIKQNVPDKIKMVPTTMKVHQAFTDTRGTIKTRVLSCFCGPSPNHCSCYDPRETVFVEHVETDLVPQVDTEDESGLSALEEPDPNTPPSEFVGKLCVVSYDNKAYPGRIVGSDVDGVEVTTLQSIGNNRFIWPKREDRIWYGYDQIITILKSINKITARRDIYGIDDVIWTQVNSKL